MGFRLVEGTYVEIAPDADGGIRSEILGLNFHLTEDGLAIYDPRAQKWLQTCAEKAEAEVERLQAELERLKSTDVIPYTQVR